MTPEQAAATAAITASIQANLTDYEAALASPAADDQIMAFRSTGLGVRFDAGKPIVCGPAFADAMQYTLPMHNGAQERAVLMTRREALEIVAASARESLAYIAQG